MVESQQRVSEGLLPILYENTLYAAIIILLLLLCYYCFHAHSLFTVYLRLYFNNVNIRSNYKSACPISQVCRPCLIPTYDLSFQRLEQERNTCEYQKRFNPSIPDLCC